MSRRLNNPSHPKWIAGASVAIRTEKKEPISAKEFNALKKRATKSQRRELSRIWSNYKNPAHADYNDTQKLNRRHDEIVFAPEPVVNEVAG